MNKIIFDIETAGVDFESLDETSQEYFLKYAATDEEKVAAKESMSFFPVTAEIVALGMLDADADKGFMFYQDKGKKTARTNKDGIDYIAATEKEILDYFWTYIKQCRQYVTFNGRGFDCPFILIRSAIQKIKPTRNIVPYRYDYKEHVDLMDQLMFYGASRRRFSLHMWCKAFGIPSPKEAGVTGLEVKDLFQQGKYLDIAQYCAGDLRATRALFHYWEQFLKF
ncbi:ribonuclease H-like domain-containing protein [Candidatus Omnitrophota bacterium]